jgi:hypothetical protein
VTSWTLNAQMRPLHGVSDTDFIGERDPAGINRMEIQPKAQR